MSTRIRARRLSERSEINRCTSEHLSTSLSTSGGNTSNAQKVGEDAIGWKSVPEITEDL